ALSILQLLPKNSVEYLSGSIKIDGKEYLKSNNNNISEVRGKKISMIFQEPMTSLNPLHTIKKQISESITIYQKLPKKEITENIEYLLEIVGLKEIIKRINSYPHELSGGQRQRVMIAMAISNNPSLLIADEPTTALDVTIQRQILDLLKSLQNKIGMSILLITHDLSIVKKFADNICVMKNGLIVEEGDTVKTFLNPIHEYTKTLINAELDQKIKKFQPTEKILLKLKNLSVDYSLKKGLFRKNINSLKALNNISFNLLEGETLGVVGESGSGKTSLALAILKLISSNGSIFFSNEDILKINSKKLRKLRKYMQIVFQDPYGSLSPRLSIKEIIGEGLDVHYRNLSSSDKSKKINEILDDVGIQCNLQDRYPHEFSGGQRQRISIARAIIIKPKLIILDEPTSALDKTVQAQIIDLLSKLQDKYNLTYIFISHDLKIIKALSDKVIVLKKGNIVEMGSTEQIFNKPNEKYTIELLEALLD
ncbi:MAG: microcin ABC transporter ATP-binding protein, partial [Rhodospirillaceae bacterium]|nr:microcin ABC transporter ATP-binding protein [Rhodospirillaceae bacterium]